MAAVGYGREYVDDGSLTVCAVATRRQKMATAGCTSRCVAAEKVTGDRV